MADESQVEEHSSFIKSPQQLAVVVFLAFAVPIAIIVAVVQYVTNTLHVDPAHPSMSEEAVSRRIKPVGEIVLAGASAPAVTAAAAPSATPAPSAQPAGKADGKTVYDKACMMCHGAGIAGAPKAGDKAAWGPRIAQGQDTLYNHALNGIRAMPARGGNAALSDPEVKAAVDYMVGMAK